MEKQENQNSDIGRKKNLSVTVRTVFDGTQTSRQAFVRLIRRKYERENENENPKKNSVEKGKSGVDISIAEAYNRSCEAEAGGKTNGFAEDGGQL